MLLNSVLLAVCLTSAGEPIEQAEALRLRGRYEEAFESFTELRHGAPVAAAVGMARCREAVGEYDEAEQILQSAGEEHPGSAELLAHRGRLHLERGRYEQAQQAARQALDLQPDHVLATWIQAETAAQQGDIETAATLFETMTGWARSRNDLTAEQLVWVGRAMDRHARWTNGYRHFDTLINQVYPAALRKNPHYWPARYESARLFAEKFNRSEAVRDLNEALAINPRAAPVHVLRGELALQSFQLGAAARALQQARTTNPHLVETFHLEADILLARLYPDEAARVLQNALELRPGDDRTRGRLAAALASVPRQEAAESELFPVEPASRGDVFYAAMGDSFELLRNFPQAAEAYEHAYRLAPQPAEVAGRLGIVLLRLAEDRRGGKLLDESFQADPYNVRVRNLLEVLDVLSGHATLETPHFIIRFDRGMDQMLAETMAQFLEEEVYPQITEALRYEPPEKTVIEIYNRARNSSGHAWFSARMVGLPYIGTVGACAGKVIAIASPGDMPQPYNWARVVRHEFVHVVNLQQTDFRVPHWFTEGIAVHFEGNSRPFAWNQLLARYAAADRLLSLDQLNEAFIRPASNEQWTLAYLQSQLAVQFAIEQFGPETLHQLLEAYTSGQRTDQAMESVLKISVQQFERQYRQYIADYLLADGVLMGDAEAADEGRMPAAERLAEVLQVVRQAEHAGEEQLDRAIGLCREAMEKYPENGQWPQLLARLALNRGDDRALAEALRVLADRDPDNLVYRKKLAQLAMDAQDAPEAIRWAREVLFIDVQDTAARQILENLAP